MHSICLRSDVTRCILFYGAHWHSLCPASLQHLAVPQDFIPLSVPLWNDLADPVFDSVGLSSFKSRANAFHWTKLLDPFSLLVFPLSLFSLYVLFLWGWGLLTGNISITLLQHWLPTSVIKTIIIKRVNECRAERFPSTSIDPVY